MYNQRLDLHENPVRAGFVREPQEWLYGSAIDYYISNGKGLLDLAGLYRGELSNGLANPRDLRQPRDY